MARVMHLHLTIVGNLYFTSERLAHKSFNSRVGVSPGECSVTRPAGLSGAPRRALTPRYDDE